MAEERRPAQARRTEQLRRLTLDIPATLHKRLKRMALEEDTTVLAMVSEWFEQHVRKWEKCQHHRPDA